MKYLYQLKHWHQWKYFLQFMGLYIASNFIFSFSGALFYIFARTDVIYAIFALIFGVAWFLTISFALYKITENHIYKRLSPNENTASVYVIPFCIQFGAVQLIWCISIYIKQFFNGIIIQPCSISALSHALYKVYVVIFNFPNVGNKPGRAIASSDAIFLPLLISQVFLVIIMVVIFALIVRGAYKSARRLCCLEAPDQFKRVL